MIRKYLFSIFFILYSILYSQDIRQAEFKYLCSNQTVTGVSPQATRFTNIRANCDTSPLSPKLDFYLVKIKTGSTFTFTLTPNARIDFDFASWLNPNLENLGLGDRGSSNDPHALRIYSIGLQLNKPNVCDNAGVASDGKVRHYDVQPGDIILIAVDRWEEVEAGYSITFGGDAILDCTFNGNEYRNCTPNGESVFNLNEIKQSLLSTYPAGYSLKFYLSQQDALANNTNNYTDSSIQIIGESKELYIQLRNQNNILDRIVKITLRNLIQLEFTPNPIEYCMDANHRSINLFDAIPITIQNSNDHLIKFYRSESDLLNNVNAITNPENYTENLNQIFVRTEHRLDENCFTTSSFMITQTPAELEVLSPYINCNQQTNVINLTEITSTYTNLSGYTLRYYSNLQDARRNENEITNPTIWLLDGNTSFYVKAIKANECVKLFEIPIHVEAPQFDFISDQYTICEGDTLVLDFSNFSEDLIIEGDHTIISRNVFEMGEGNFIVKYITSSLCEYQKQFTVISEPVPIFAEFEPIKVCDTNFDGIYTIDLEQIRQRVVQNIGSDFLVKLYLSENEALQQLNPLTEPVLTTNNLPIQIWVRANNNRECFAIKSIDIFINQSTEFTPSTQRLEICENTESSINRFDLTSMLPFYQIDSNTSTKFYRSRQDANDEINEIENPSNWETETFNGEIFVRLEKNGLCPVITSFNYVVQRLQSIQIEETIAICEGESYTLDLSSYTDLDFEIIRGNFIQISPRVFVFDTAGSYIIKAKTQLNCEKEYNFNLIINSLPQFSINNSFAICDNNQDGVYEVNLEQLADLFLINREGLRITYFRTESDLLNHQNEITNEIFVTNLPAKVWIKAITSSNCFAYKGIDIVPANSIDFQSTSTILETCLDQEGRAIFNLMQMRSVLNISPTVEMTFYETLEDLQNNQNPINDPENWSTIRTSGKIFVKLEEEGFCSTQTEFEFLAHPFPNLQVEDTYWACESENFELDFSTYNFTILIDGNGVLANGNNRFTITEEGLYTLIVRNEFGCMSSYQFETKRIHIPQIESLLIGLNTITVKLTQPISSAIEYSLDGINFQYSNVLIIPEKGKIYDIYVSINGCIYLIKTIETIDFSTFFSPNSDGFNDNWQVKIPDSVSKYQLQIFNRYGKLLKDINYPDQLIWDGKYNGKILPADSYWINLKIIDPENNYNINYTGSILLKSKY